ncbi:MAG: LOG family protein [Saprospiraceae bacterium]|nr:LOG family protein [Saprospiraceae bacterium]
MGKLLSEMGFASNDRWRPQIMEAANRGAYNAGGQSIGCTIKLPKEQSSNPFMTRIVEFDYFFVRKVLLTKYSYSFVVMPVGSHFDELFGKHLRLFRLVSCIIFQW